MNVICRKHEQMNLIAQSNVTQNFLSISISGAQAKAIEVEAAPIRESVAQMFSKYRPALGNGNGAGEAAEPVVAQNATKAPLIERKPGQENSSTFWNIFASGDRDRLVERETAIYVVRTIVGEVLGTHRVGQVNFEEGDITVGDCLDAIDRKVGVGNAAGWQRLQVRAGIKPGPGA